MPMPESTIDIAELPSPARLALARAINERRTPLAQHSGGGWIAYLCIGICVLGYALYAGFGEPYGHHDHAQSLMWYGAGVAGIAGGILLMRRKKALTKVLGFTPGVYAIGSRLVDARKRKLEVYDLFAAEPRIVHRYVNGGYRHTTLTWHSFQFTFGRQPMAGQALEMLNVNLAALRKAAGENDIATMLALDPIALGIVLSKDSDEPKPVIPKSSPMPLLVFAGATLALTPAIWFVRNYASQEVAYGRIHSPSEATAWMADGGDEARGKAKLMETDLRMALTVDGDRADKLREVLARYPDAPADLKKPVEDALEKRYEDARKASLALSSSEQLTWYINQVYDRLEATGAKAVMAIKVKRTDNTELAKLDERVAADAKLKKTIVPVARYFDTAEDASHTAALKGAIQKGMGQFFPADVMVFSDEDSKDNPTIEIFYVIRPKMTDDGDPSLYTEIDEHDKPIPGSLEYPGIEFELGATMQVPGGKEPHEVRFTARPSPTISVEHLGPKSLPGEDPASSLDNSAVYRAMADSAFSDLQNKLVLALGGKPDPEEAKRKEAVDDGPPEEPECAALVAKLDKLDACKTLAKADRASLQAALKKMAEDKTTEPATLCKAGDALVQKNLDKAHCK